MKTLIIILLAVTVVFLSDRLVREENQHYALLIGMCQIPADRQFSDFKCLDKVQTRTSWVAHFYYALTNNLPSVASAVPLFKGAGDLLDLSLVQGFAWLDTNLDTTLALAYFKWRFPQEFAEVTYQNSVVADRTIPKLVPLNP